MEKLPVDITTAILLRLPLKSIGQGRCVSKLWYSILHHDSLKQRKDILLYYFYRPRIICLEDNEQTSNQTPIKLVKNFDFDFISNHFNECDLILGTCNGFFCIAREGESVWGTCNPIYVFNPITEEHAMLPYYEFQQHDPPTPYDNHKTKIDWFLSGFGFEDSSNKFKFVLVFFSGWNFYGTEYLVNELQVHTLGTTTWTRKVGIVPDRLSKATTYAVVTNGCLHWITFDVDLLIVLFNLAVEEFGFVPVPESLLLEPHSNYSDELNLGLVEDCLSIVDCSLTRRVINIWVMKTYNVHESWIKEYSLKLGWVSHLPHVYKLEFVKFLSNGEVLIVGNDNFLVSYNVISQESRFLEGEWVDEGNYFKAFPFVGNLISLESACGIDNDAKET